MDSHEVLVELVGRLRKRCAEYEKVIAVLRERLGDE